MEVMTTTTDSRNSTNSSQQTTLTDKETTETATPTPIMIIQDDCSETTTTWIDRCLTMLQKYKLYPFCEIILAWTLSMCCLLFYGYSYLIRNRRQHQSNQQSKACPRIPLVTTVRRRRHQQCGDKNSCSTSTRQSSSCQDVSGECNFIQLYQQIDQFVKEIPDNTSTDDILACPDLIENIRNDIQLRRLVEDFMISMEGKYQQSPFQTAIVNDQTTTTTTTTTTRRNETLRQNRLENITRFYHFLHQNWIDLLRFPSQPETSPFEISLIIPAYRESMDNLRRTIDQALRTCTCPSTVQVVVVDAGQCTGGNVSAILTQLYLPKRIDIGHLPQRFWGDFKVVIYPRHDGRGPTLNYGTEHATGRFFTFLHSDTLIPTSWDVQVRKALLPSSNPNTITQACAFAFGHDTDNLNNMPYPWGIRAVWFLGNLRAYLFSLPYGDHIISVPATYFRYVGGYPHQPIMEDYVLMDLFRQRAKQPVLRESIKVILNSMGRCSVRRWQQLGVVYVTLANAIIVHRYESGVWDSYDIFAYYYYKRSLPNKKKN